MLAGCTGGGSSPVEQPSMQPTNPADPGFQLGAPPLPVIGGVVFRRPRCHPNEIIARAITKRGAYGVLGVITLRGTAFRRVKIGGRYERLRCSLPIRHGPTGLLDQSGHTLQVPLARGNRENPPGNIRPDEALTNGSAWWGFSWLGSYCGPPATALRLPINPPGTPPLVVPLSGASLACHGRSKSQLFDGVPGAPGDPVQPAPPAFSRLRLRLRVQAGTTRKRVADIKATLTTTGADVVLSPCPSVDGYVSGTAGGGFGGPMQPFPLDCVPGPTLVGKSHPLHFTIAGPLLTDARHRGADVHSTVTIRVALAGAPSATLVVHVP
jgi:hypothetical protein